MKFLNLVLALVGSSVLGGVACSSDDKAGTGTGGSGPGSAGTTGTAGATAGTGAGVAGAMGSAGAAGTASTAGAAGAGGAGTAGSAGAGGGGGSGGAAGGGSAGSSGSGTGGGSATMSFFVTSKGPGKGGDFGGLDGADAFCKTLATAVSAELGSKTWRAYLSTSTVNARDRIGTGPWRNAKGVIIANNLADLHSQDMATGALNATWPIGSNAIALDETGAEVPSSPTTHDILTGSSEAGMAVANSTCMDWTSSATTVKGTVGHSNRNGGGRPPSWNSAHESGGCGDISGTRNVSVGSGGGRGSIYCFALP
jgi:hypothetical protein